MVSAWWASGVSAPRLIARRRSEARSMWQARPPRGATGVDAAREAGRERSRTTAGTRDSSVRALGTSRSEREWLRQLVAVRQAWSSRPGVAHRGGAHRPPGTGRNPGRQPVALAGPVQLDGRRGGAGSGPRARRSRRGRARPAADGKHRSTTSGASSRTSNRGPPTYEADAADRPYGPASCAGPPRGRGAVGDRPRRPRGPPRRAVREVGRELERKPRVEDRARTGGQRPSPPSGRPGRPRRQ